MNLRWLWGNYALKEHELDGRTASELSRLAHKKHLSRRTFLIWTIFALVLPVLVVYKFVLPMVLDWVGMAGQNVPYFIGIAGVIVAFWIWSAWVYRYVYVKPMRRAIREATGRDVCVECGYDLAGLGDDSGRCPECGGRREAKYAGPPAEQADG